MLGVFTRNGSSMFQNRSRQVPEASQKVLGHFWVKSLFSKSTNHKTNIHRTSRRLKPIFPGDITNIRKGAHRNSASLDVPDSYPSFLRTLLAKQKRIFLSCIETLAKHIWKRGQKVFRSVGNKYVQSWATHM